MTYICQVNMNFISTVREGVKKKNDFLDAQASLAPTQLSLSVRP